jgi:hypothetical protein
VSSGLLDIRLRRDGPQPEDLCLGQLDQRSGRGRFDGELPGDDGDGQARAVPANGFATEMREPADGLVVIHSGKVRCARRRGVSRG